MLVFFGANFGQYFFGSSVLKKSSQSVTVQIPLEQNYGILKVVPSCWSLPWRNSDPHLWPPLPSETLKHLALRTGPVSKFIFD